jgi:SulP family sulfate permease
MCLLVNRKEALGIRMFLFATIIGQVVFTTFSGFVNPIGLQMVENVPFCHALSHIVIQHQGYGINSLSTLFVMFGLSSIIVGAVFYGLGRFQLGRVVYYFPTHVLVGCIGGIGVFLFKTAIEVTINAVFGWQNILEHGNLLLPVVLFECTLRLLERITLDAEGKPLFSLLSPVFFIMITPIFYAALWILGIEINDANEAGYLFPSLLEKCGDLEYCASSSMWDTIFNKDLFDIWRVIDLSVVSWSAIADSIPTLIALTLFSLIHVPINIPAFALSTNVEADMNRELVAHGYSNFIAGLFGGLQNYMAYTQSVLYHKASGRGKVSGYAVAILTAFLFFVGPTIASYIPKCMAGALLVHVGIDLFLEGVYDSFGKFDRLEYSGIWLIVIVMTLKGMDAAMVAGVIAAVSTYAVQSITYINPIRGFMSASTLRSSRQNITNEARSALEDETIGRNRILVIQLQGHLFFGNMAHLTQSINKILSERQKSNASAWIVILDYSLVLSIDSSAAQTMTKLRRVLRQSYNVDLCIFVSGSEEGFPCQMDLSKELNTLDFCSPLNKIDAETDPNEESALLGTTMATSNDFCGSRVEVSLDSALVFAENALLSRQGIMPNPVKKLTTPFNERNMALEFLTNLCPSDIDPVDVMRFLNHCSREVYRKNDLIWSQGSPSDCVKLLVQGSLISLLENEAGTRELISSGNTIGELALLLGLNRMSSVYCLSDEAVLYNLSRESFEDLSKTSPNVARLLDLICIRYLSARVQHVSNRIFETRCLPI